MYRNEGEKVRRNIEFQSLNGEKQEMVYVEFPHTASVCSFKHVGCIRYALTYGFAYKWNGTEDKC